MDTDWRDIFHYDFKKENKDLVQMDSDKLINLELESDYTQYNFKQLNKFLNGVISGQK